MQKNNYLGPRPKGQHSAPRGGPPRSWTNDDLTKALEMVWNKRMTTSQASRVFGIPYNSLLMYVRGKYGKSLRLDVLKKNTPAANDNLNTIGNSRSTPKEKGLKKEKEEKASRKLSHDSAAAAAGFPLFPFDAPPIGGGLSPFGPSGFMPFPPLGEPMGLFGIPNADFRLKELMQSVQNLQSQQLRDSEADKIKDAIAASDFKENRDQNTTSHGSGGLGVGTNSSNANSSSSSNSLVTNKTECDMPMGLASLIMKAREFQDKKAAELEEEEEAEEGMVTDDPANSSDDKGVDEMMDTDIPQIAIKPLEVVAAAQSAAAPSLEIKVPPPTASEISAQ